MCGIPLWGTVLLTLQTLWKQYLIYHASNSSPNAFTIVNDFHKSPKSIRPYKVIQLRHVVHKSFKRNSIGSHKVAVSISMALSGIL